jgi:PQQ enzyme repeat
MSIPGFGPIIASVMAATIQDASSFAGPREFALGIAFKWGMPLVNGVAITAGGLVFTGAIDAYLRALDAKSGEELWQGRLPAAPAARRLKGGYDLMGFVLPRPSSARPERRPDGPLRLVGVSSDLAAADDAWSARLTDKIANVT